MMVEVVMETDINIRQRWVWLLRTAFLMSAEKSLNFLCHIALIPPCDTRREKVGALYCVVSGLLAVISRAYPQFLSPVSRSIYL